MRLQCLAYRGHNPRWSFAPISGAGAAVHGGRFNPKGVPALYLALTANGAILEATQGFAYKFNPLTLCTYEIDCDSIVDLRSDAALNEFGLDRDTLAAPWALALSQGRRPASWVVHDRLAAGNAGVIVPSFAINAGAEMANLVLWRWSDALPHRVVVFDPEQRLPRDQRSWS